MELAVGEIISGKVTGITKFGAFVSLPEGKTGLVHISEVDQSYVSNIRDHLSEGQEVKVKVIAVDENGRINLSIKKAQLRPAMERRPFNHRNNHNGGNGGNHAGRNTGYPQRSGSRRPQRPINGTYVAAKEVPTSFEDKLKHFMQDSESRMADIRRNTDKKNGSRRRK